MCLFNCIQPRQSRRPMHKDPRDIVVLSPPRPIHIVEFNMPPPNARRRPDGHHYGCDEPFRGAYGPRAAMPRGLEYAHRSRFDGDTRGRRIEDARRVEAIEIRQEEERRRDLHMQPAMEMEQDRRRDMMRHSDPFRPHYSESSRPRRVGGSYGGSRGGAIDEGRHAVPQVPSYGGRPRDGTYNAVSPSQHGFPPRETRASNAGTEYSYLPARDTGRRL